MRRFAIVSCNRFVNFTNYGSALQTYALRWAINHLSDDVEAITLNYCPDSMAEMNPLDPVKHMWDKDAQAKKQIKDSYPAIQVNFEKFEHFYDTECAMTPTKYTSNNFDLSLSREQLDGYVCGSDTIWNVDEFGIDPGYFACFDSMKKAHSIAYAACFGDAQWSEAEAERIAGCLQNFKAIGTREDDRLSFVRENVTVPAQRVVDPTLLVPCDAYDSITIAPGYSAPYLLYYSRRFDPSLEAHVERIAKNHHLDIVEISLRQQNASKGHIMRYDAGVEEFLGLVKNASYVATNSFHGAIFSIIFNVPFSIATREQASTKINELLDWVGLSDRKYHGDDAEMSISMDFASANKRLDAIRIQSLAFLRNALEI